MPLVRLACDVDDTDEAEKFFRRPQAHNDGRRVFVVVVVFGRAALLRPYSPHRGASRSHVRPVTPRARREPARHVSPRLDGLTQRMDPS